MKEILWVTLEYIQMETKMQNTVIQKLYSWLIYAVMCFAILENLRYRETVIVSKTENLYI